MKKSQKNVAQKYLSQKSNSALEVVFAVLLALGVICFLVYNKFLSVPIITVAGVGMLFVKSVRIKDSEYDEIIEIVLRENGVELDKSKQIAAYDLSESPITVGSDKKARTPVYSVATFEFSDEKCKIKAYRVNVVERTVDAGEYDVTLGSGCRIEQITVKTSAGNRRMDVMLFDEHPTLKIPTENLSYDAEEILKKLQKK